MANPSSAYVHWWHGPAGTGKSHTVREMYPDAHLVNDFTPRAFDYYTEDTSERVLVLEDVPLTRTKWAAVVREIERRRWQRIIIISNQPPPDVILGGERLAIREFTEAWDTACVRRVHVVS